MLQELDQLPQIVFQAEPSSSNSGFQESGYRGSSSSNGSELKKSKSNDEEPTCNVCLEEFQKGDQLRILPCFHKFHVKCIDKWLKQSKFCPTCRHICNEGIS